MLLAELLGKALAHKVCNKGCLLDKGHWRAYILKLPLYAFTKRQQEALRYALGASYRRAPTGPPEGTYSLSVTASILYQPLDHLNMFILLSTHKNIRTPLAALAPKPLQ